MQDLKKDNLLILFIKYSLPILVIFLSILTTTFLYFENKFNFEKLKQTSEEKLLNEKKQIIKEQVDSVYNYIIKEQKDVNDNLKKSLKNKVREVHTIAKHLYKKYKNTYSKGELSDIISSSIRDIRFHNNRAYFFIFDKKGINRLHPLLPNLEGTSVFNVQDTKGSYIVKEPLKILKNKDETFYEWYWIKEKEDKNEYKKTGFLKNFKELGWVIGTGEYIDDFSKDIQEKVLNQLEKFRFGKTGYIFIFNEQNIYLSSQRKGLKGKSVFEQNNLKDTVTTMQDMWSKAKNGGGFVTYIQKTNPITKEPTKKIAYVKNVPNWNWLIGTGFYLDEIKKLVDEQKELLTKQQNENIKKLLALAFIISIFLLFISLYISKIVKDRFLKHQEAQKALKESENKFRHIIEQAPFSLELYDKNGFLIITNPAHDKLWDFDNILIKNKFNILRSKEFKHTGLFEYIQKAYNGEIVNIPSTKFDPTIVKEAEGKGRTRVINTTIYPIKNIENEVENIVIVHEDITEKKKAEKELKKREKILEVIIQEAPNPIIIHNEDGKVLMLNKVWQELSGYKFEEINTIDKWINVVYEKDATLIKKHIQKLYNIKRKVVEGEFSFLNKKKELITWQFSSAPLGLIDGKKVVITSAMDVTELNKKNTLLHQQSKMAAMGEMIGNIAHQWRQPLSTISTAATGVKLQKELGALNDENFYDAMDAINDSAQFLSQTIEDFRGFFKPKNNKDEKFTIHHLIKKTLKLVNSELVSKEINVIEEIEDFELSSFENELIQVLVNILNNARDALILNKVERKLIFIKSYKDKNNAYIEIYDNAGGIEKKIIDRIFEPYFTTKHMSKGTGIGLYMSQDILKNILNATISVENFHYMYEKERYLGAKFIIEIPTEK